MVLLHEGTLGLGDLFQRVGGGDSGFHAVEPHGELVDHVFR